MRDVSWPDWAGAETLTILAGVGAIALLLVSCFIARQAAGPGAKVSALWGLLGPFGWICAGLRGCQERLRAVAARPVVQSAPPPSQAEIGAEKAWLERVRSASSGVVEMLDCGLYGAEVNTRLKLAVKRAAAGRGLEDPKTANELVQAARGVLVGMGQEQREFPVVQKLRAAVKEDSWANKPRAAARTAAARASSSAALA